MGWQAMRRGAALIALVATMFAFGAQAKPPAPQLVFRIDRVTATIVHRKLVIEVSGAVPSGGWAHPRLRAKPTLPEAHFMVMEFVANPPPPKHVVIQALLPVKAKMQVGLPRYAVTAVKVIARTNAVMTEITIKR
jgi:hypothetical protein